jgi:uncharacterized membrane protein
MKELEEMELSISRFLRSGVLFAGVTIALGWLLNLRPDHRVFNDLKAYEHIPLRNVFIYHYGQGNWAFLFSYLGLGVLISLPLLRVLFTGLLFFRQKDHLLAVIAALVLLSLLFGFSLGMAY